MFQILWRLTMIIAKSKWAIPYLLFFIFLSHTGCGSPDLSENKVIELVRKYEKENSPENRIPAYMQKNHLLYGLKRGYFERFHNPYMGKKGFIITQKGRDIFSHRVTGSTPNIKICSGGITCTEVHITAEAKIDNVTNISVGEKEKKVKFLSKPILPEIINKMRSELPPEPVSPEGNTIYSLKDARFEGEATFKLYENGWELEDISY